jgi:hypothetical protein
MQALSARCSSTPRRCWIVQFDVGLSNTPGLTVKCYLVYGQQLVMIYFLQIFALHVTGTLNTVLSTEHRREICRYIYNHQACKHQFLLLYSFSPYMLFALFFDGTKKHGNTVCNALRVE